jgi:hypothetical protein
MFAQFESLVRTEYLGEKSEINISSQFSVRMQKYKLVGGKKMSSGRTIKQNENKENAITNNLYS